MRPKPPVARTVFLANMRWKVPSSMLRQRMPTHELVAGHMRRSRAKYSRKKLVLCLSDWP